MGSNFDIVFRFSEVPSCLKSLSLISRFQEPARDRERELLAASRAYESLGSLYGQAGLSGSSSSSNSPAQSSKYTQLLAVIEEIGKDIRPTYAGSKSSAERLKRGESI